MQKYFNEWGSFYECITGLVFGIISVILWFRDRNKSISIKELKEQSEVLSQQLKIINQNYLDLHTPNLRITKNIYHMNKYHTVVENIGGGVFDLNCPQSSLEKYFTLSFLNPPSDLSPHGSFAMTYFQSKEKDTLVVDRIVFHYKDKFGRKFSQKMQLQMREDVFFEPPILIG